MAWNHRTGFYIGNVILEGEWGSELQFIETKVGEHINKQCLEDRDFDSKITWASFKSKDGQVYTKPAILGKGEIPEDFVWTEIYYNNPNLKALIDWFPVEKTRVRLARQNPGVLIEPHFDWDNLRHNNDPDNELVRIWVALDDAYSWYRLTNGDVEANFQLAPGQFVILNTDTIIHQTENCDAIPRNNLIIHAKVNNWIKCLSELFPRHKVLDPRIHDPQ